MKRLIKPWDTTHKSLQGREQELNGGIFEEILQSKARWEEAYMYFEEALGEDQVDYAIYMLEAAERKYQMHLKQAKKLGIVANHYLEASNQKGRIVNETVLGNSKSIHMKGE